MPLINAPHLGSPNTWRYTGWMISGCLVLYFFCIRFPVIMTMAGVSHQGVWFMDTFAILAALDAQRLGLNPYAFNPLNYFGGPHVYSHWWFFLGKFPLSRADTMWLGSLVSFSALFAAWMVLRPRNGREVIWSLLVLCSAPLVLGLNRGNADLLLFALLSLCVPCVCSSTRWLRVVAAPLLITIAMGLKYYPACAGLIILAVRPALDRRIALVVAVSLIVAAGINVAPEITKYTSDLRPQGLYTFGATTGFIAAGIWKTNNFFFTSALLLTTGYGLMRRSSLRDWNVPRELRADYLFFILGATILSGAFIATVNYGYRWVYAIWMIPFLCRAQAFMPGSYLSGLMRCTRLLLLVALWSDMIVALTLNLTFDSADEANRWVVRFNSLQQPFIWGLFICLSAWLVHFVSTQLRQPVAAEALGEITVPAG